MLQGCVLTRIDNFTIAGKKEFIDRVLNLVEVELTVSKIEKDNFHYTGLDISTVKDGIKIKVKDYAERLQDFREI